MHALFGILSLRMFEVVWQQLELCIFRAWLHARPRIFNFQEDQSMQGETQMTGYPSIDKPWLKYYSEEEKSTPLPNCTIYKYLYDNNICYLHDTALCYLGTKITYGKLFENIEKTAKALAAMGVSPGDIVAVLHNLCAESIRSGSKPAGPTI